MFGKQLKLFKLLGFEVKVDASWLIIAVLIVWSLAQGVFPYYYAGLARAAYWGLGVLGAIGLFLSIIVHEFSHSLVARRFGLPMKGITLFVFGGVAEMEDEPPSPKAEFFMALAGPAASLAIGGAFYSLRLAGNSFAWAPPPMMLITYLGTINVILAVFNMLPAFPLDGGRVFRSILWHWKKNLRWATRVASMVGTGFGLALIFFGVFSLVSGGVVGGIWWAMIGLFLRGASRSSYQSVLIRTALEGEHVERFMKGGTVPVSPDTTIDHLVEDYAYRYNFKLFPVSHNGDPVACVNVNDVKNLPREEWNSHTVAELAKPCSSDTTVKLNDNAIKALSIMNRTGNSRLIVLDDDGKFLGTINLRDLMRFLSLKLDLEQEDVDQIDMKK